MAAVNQTVLRHQMNAGKPCYTKECEVTPNEQNTQNVLVTLTIKYFYADLYDLLLLLHDSHKKLIPIINRSRTRNHLKPIWSTSQILVLEI